jgi:hypothetical protein
MAITKDRAGERPARKVPPFWGVDSTPFSGAEGVQPCRIVLHQVDDNDFDLVERLVVRAPASLPDLPSGAFVIEPSWVKGCDLASIPGVLGWFARRHGRHTGAALVHDLLILDRGTELPEDVPPEWRLPPEQADLLFRELLLACGVPPVRSYVMWAAVAARTRWYSGLRRKAGMVAWGLSAGAGTVALVLGLVRGDWMLAGAATVAPVAGALLWGRQCLAGLIAGYAVWWALAGSAPAWVAYKVYQGVEGLVWLVAWVRRRLAGASTGDLVGPVRHNER